MKWLMVLCCLLLTGPVFSQFSYDRVTISKFTKSNDLALLDTLKKFINNNRYLDFISNEVEVYSKQSKNNFAGINKLVNAIQRNGSDDISKCFVPRHSMNFYKGGQVVRYVLICFECEGLRFSEERRKTYVRNEEKRITQMKQLKEYFAANGLIE